MRKIVLAALVPAALLGWTAAGANPTEHPTEQPGDHKDGDHKEGDHKGDHHGEKDGDHHGEAPKDGHH